MRPCAKRRLAGPFIRSQHLLISQRAAGSLRSSGLANTFYLLDHTEKGPLILQQNARFSTEGEVEPIRMSLLINTAEKLPVIYASPTAIVETRIAAPLDFECK